MDYYVYEAMQGKIIGDVLKIFDFQEQAEKWCFKALREWKFNAGINKEYVIYIHSTKAAHLYCDPDTGSQTAVYWHRNGSMTRGNLQAHST